MQINQKVTVEIQGEPRSGRVVEIVDRVTREPDYFWLNDELVYGKRESRKYRVDVEGLGDSFIFFEHELTSG